MLKRWLRFPIEALVLLTPVLALSMLGSGSEAWGEPPKSAPDQPKADAKPVATSSLGWEFDEEVARTREDLANLQLWLNAKRAQLKAAELSSGLEHKFQGEYDRLLKKGMTTPLRREVADLEFLESESQRSLIQAEIGDLQTKYNRSKRYLARLEQYGTSAMKSPDDHTLELTEVQTRLKYAERMISKLQEELKDSRVELEKVTRVK